MVTEIIEMGSISSRGQIAIPSGIRKALGLEEGSKVLFMVHDNTLFMKKVTPETFNSITKPLKEAAIKANMKEADAVDIVHRFRRRKK